MVHISDVILYSTEYQFFVGVEAGNKSPRSGDSIVFDGPIAHNPTSVDIDMWLSNHTLSEFVDQLRWVMS